MRHQNSAYGNHCLGPLFVIAGTWGRYIFQPLQEVIQGLYIAINGSTLLISEGNFLKHHMARCRMQVYNFLSNLIASPVPLRVSFATPSRGCFALSGSS